MMTYSFRFSKRLAVVAVISATSTTAASAAEEFTFGKLVVLQPRVESASVRGERRLRLGFVNDGSDSIHIVRITSPSFRNARIQIVTPDGSSRPLASLTLTAGERSSLGRSNLRIVLSGPREAEGTRDRVDVTLHTADGHRLTFPAQISGPAPAF